MPTTSQKSTLKAYTISDDDEYHRLVFAESRGKAKSRVAGDFGDDFIYIRARREAWLDKFQSVDKVPAWFLVDGGWWFECWHCGETINSDNCYDKGNSTSDVVGMYTGAVYCDEKCKKAEEECRYQTEVITEVMKREMQAQITRLCGPEVIFDADPYVYVNRRNMEVMTATISFKLPFQTDYSCSGKAEWSEQTAPLEVARHAKLKITAPQADAAAVQEFLNNRV